MPKNNHVASNAMNKAIGYHSNRSNNSNNSDKGFVTGAVTSFKGNINQFGHDLEDFKIGLSSSGGYRHTRKSNQKRGRRRKCKVGKGTRRTRRTRRSRRRRCR